MSSENDEIECNANSIAGCEADDPFSGEPFSAQGKVPVDLIKLYFRKENGDRVTKCYYMEDIFKWIFRDIILNPQRQVMTPTRNILSQAQIDRLQRCYFERQNRRFQTLAEFREFVLRDYEEQQRLAESAGRAELALLVANPSNYMIIIDWLQEMYPKMHLTYEEYFNVADDLDSYLKSLPDFDEDNLEDVLETDAIDISSYLSNKYADFERDPDYFTIIEQLQNMSASGKSSAEAIRAWNQADENFEDALILLTS